MAREHPTLSCLGIYDFSNRFNSRISSSHLRKRSRKNSGCFLADCNRFGPRRRCCWSMDRFSYSLSAEMRSHLRTLNPESASWGSSKSPGNWVDPPQVCTNIAASAGTDHPRKTSAAREFADISSYCRCPTSTIDRSSLIPVLRSCWRTVHLHSALTLPKPSRHMTKRRIDSFVFPKHRREVLFSIWFKYYLQNFRIK